MTGAWLKSKLTLTRAIIAGNVLVALLSWALVHSGRFDFIRAYFPLHRGDLADGKVWELFTYSWIHAPLSGFWTLHLLFNMVTLASFGRVVEERLGPRNFAFIYFGGGVFAGLCALLEMSVRQRLGVEGTVSLVGASGAVLSVAAVFAWMYPEVKLLVFPVPVPIQARKVVCWMLGISWLLLLAWPDSFICHSAHIGGIVWGLFYMWSMEHPFYRGRQFRSKPVLYRGLSPRDPEDSVEEWEEDRLRVEADRVLEKIHLYGMESLTPKEKTILDRARHLL